MKARCLLLLALSVLAGCGGSPALLPTAPVAAGTEFAAKYQNELVDILQAHSFKRLQIDWTSFRAQVLAAGATATTIEGSGSAILKALTLLNDSHSSWNPPPTSKASSIYYFSKSCQLVAVTPPALPADIGYLRITAFGGTFAESLAFVDDLLEQLRTHDTGALAGWIVDLRSNNGGNMWPMLAGAGPLLGDGLAGFFKYPDGATQRWDVSGSTSRLDGSTISHGTSTYSLSAAQPRVAVLLDSGVISSGEATALAFRGRPNTRSFGAPTCGLSTGVLAYQMSDGASLFLADSLMVDRNGAGDGGSIVPDEVLEPKTAAVTRAIAWLRGS